jgi:hypothetical protein
MIMGSITAIRFYSPLPNCINQIVTNLAFKKQYEKRYRNYSLQLFGMKYNNTISTVLKAY